MNLQHERMLTLCEMLNLPFVAEAAGRNVRKQRHAHPSGGILGGVLVLIQHSPQKRVNFKSALTRQSYGCVMCVSALFLHGTSLS